MRRGALERTRFYPSPFREGRISPGLPAVLLGGAYEILQDAGVGGEAT